MTVNWGLHMGRSLCPTKYILANKTQYTVDGFMEVYMKIIWEVFLRIS